MYIVRMLNLFFSNCVASSSGTNSQREYQMLTIIMHSGRISIGTIGLKTPLCAQVILIFYITAQSNATKVYSL